jgi:hypothetical protein
MYLGMQISNVKYRNSIEHFAGSNIAYLKAQVTGSHCKGQGLFAINREGTYGRLEWSHLFGNSLGLLVVDTHRHG